MEQQFKEKNWANGNEKQQKLENLELIDALTKQNLALPVFNQPQNIWWITYSPASSHGVAIEIIEDEIKQRWLNKPKGLLQILWKQGWIDPSENLNNYLQNFVRWHGKVIPEFQNDEKILSACPDFKYKKLSMQKLSEDLSQHHHDFELLIMPKYHCKLAREGIKYVWCLFKKYFCCTPHAEKRCKPHLKFCVGSSLTKVSVDHIQRFSSCACCYMLRYTLLNSLESLESHSVSYGKIKSCQEENKGALEYSQPRKFLYCKSMEGNKEVVRN